MKHTDKFHKHLDEIYSPVKIYARWYQFSEVLSVRQPELYAQMYYEFVLSLAQDDATPPQSPTTARPRGL